MTSNLIGGQDRFTVVAAHPFISIHSISFRRPTSRNKKNQMHTPDRTITKVVRHANQAMSGGSFVAFFSLVIVPDLAVAIPIAIQKEDSPASARAFPAIERGLKHFIAWRLEQRTPVSGFRMYVTDVVEHPDFKEFRFVEATIIALKDIFDLHEILTGAPQNQNTIS